jgi:hypothetical protein
MASSMPEQPDAGMERATPHHCGGNREAIRRKEAERIGLEVLRLSDSEKIELRRGRGKNDGKVVVPRRLPKRIAITREWIAERRPLGLWPQGFKVSATRRFDDFVSTMRTDTNGV